MLQGRFEWAVGVVCATVVATIVAWYAVVWSRHVERTTTESAPSAEASAQAVTPRTPIVRMVEPAVTPAAPATSVRLRPSRFNFVAARGDTWLQVRSRSHTGHVLFEGNVSRGDAVRLRARRLWVRFGSASNVDLLIDGQLADLPLFGTYDAYITRHGARADPVVHPNGQATAAQSP